MQDGQLKLGLSLPDQSGPGVISPDTLAEVFFILVILAALFYTLVVAYHWLTYGRNSVLAIPSLVVHIFVSLALIGFAATGFN